MRRGLGTIVTPCFGFYDYASTKGIVRHLAYLPRTRRNIQFTVSFMFIEIDSGIVSGMRGSMLPPPSVPFFFPLCQCGIVEERKTEITPPFSVQSLQPVFDLDECRPASSVLPRTCRDANCNGRSVSL